MLSDRLLDVLRDCVARGDTKAGQSTAQPSTAAAPAEEDTGDADSLLVAYQKLYALSILTTLTTALQVTPQAAAILLSNISGKAVVGTAAAAVENSSTGMSNLEKYFQETSILEQGNGVEDEYVVVEDITEEIKKTSVAQGDAGSRAIHNNDGEDDDDAVYEPLYDGTVPSSSTSLKKHDVNTQLHHQGSSGNIDVEEKLIFLSSRLNYHLVPSSAAWQDGVLLNATHECILTLRNHPKFLQLLPAVGALCALLQDRIFSTPKELEKGVDALINGLKLAKSSETTQVDSSAANSAATLLGLGIAAALSVRLPSGPPRRQFWTQVRSLWLPAAAEMMERGEMQLLQRSRKTKSTNSNSNESAERQEHHHLVSIAACISEFYVTDAPLGTKAAQIQDLLLSSGIFRGLVLAFIREGKEPTNEALRRAVLVCCAASPGLLTWASAVPNFSAAWEQPEFCAPGGVFALYGALHAALSSHQHGDEALAAHMLGEERETRDLTVDDVPRLYTTLVLLDAVHRAASASSQGSGSGRQQSVWGSATEAALHSVTVALRSLVASKGDGGDGDISGEKTSVAVAEDEEAEDAAKLELNSEVHAGQLAARRAQMLQPECLKLLKGLRAKPGSVGKSD